MCFTILWKRTQRTNDAGFVGGREKDKCLGDTQKNQLPPVIETGTLGYFAIAAIPRSTTELKKLVVDERVNWQLPYETHWQSMLSSRSEQTISRCTHQLSFHHSIAILGLRQIVNSLLVARSFIITNTTSPPIQLRLQSRHENLSFAPPARKVTRRRPQV